MKRFILILTALALVICIGAQAETREELRNSYVAQGYTVEPVSNWELVGLVDGARFFDVPYFYDASPRRAQVKVTDIDTPQETATVINRLNDAEEQPTTFSERLTTFLRSMEVGNVYAIERVTLSELDAVATVRAYILTDNTVSEKMYVVRYRAETMEFKELV